MGLFSRTNDADKPYVAPLESRLPVGFRKVDDDMYQLTAVPLDVIHHEEWDSYIVLFDNGAYGIRDCSPVGYESSMIERLQIRTAIRNVQAMTVQGEIKEVPVFGKDVIGITIEELIR